MSAAKSKLRVSLRKNGTAKESAAMLSRDTDCWQQLLALSNNKLKVKAQRFFIAATGVELTAATCANLLWDAGDGVCVAVSKGEQYETHLTAKQKADAKAAAAAAAPTAAADAKADAKAVATSAGAAAAAGAGAAVAAGAAADPKAALAVHTHKSDAAVRVLCRASWLDETAVTQLRATASGFSDCVLAVGMPDLHPGNTYPIGTAFASRANIYPHLIGGDIGCGMSLVQTQLRADRASSKRVERWASRLRGLDERWDGDIAQWLSAPLSWPHAHTAPAAPVASFGGDAKQKQTPAAAQASHAAAKAALEATVCSVEAVDAQAFRDAGVSLSAFDAQVGTIGGGNHFAELQAVERVVDRAVFDAYGLSESVLYVLVHSGSRGLGDAVLERHTKVFSTGGLKRDSAECATYLRLHAACCMWAKRNRALIAQRFLTLLGAAGASNADDGDDVAAAAPGGVPVAAAAGAAAADAKAAAAGDLSAGTKYRCVLDVWHNLVVPHDLDLRIVNAQRARDAAEAQKLADEKTRAVAAGGASGAAPGPMPGLAVAPPHPDDAKLAAASAKADTDAKARVYVHRKGATPSDQGLVVIPGSRGDYSYVVLPNSDVAAQHLSCLSLAHGAGRKWHRGKAKKTLSERFPDADKLKRTDLSSHVICEDKDLLYEEAPQAYKDAESIIADLTALQLVTVVAVLRPLITYKMRRA